MVAMEDYRKHTSLFDKLWEAHVVEHWEDGNDLLAVDRIYLHDLCGTYSFRRMDDNGYDVFCPSQVYAMPDHTLSISHDRQKNPSQISVEYLRQLREGCSRRKIVLFDDGSDKQGIVHVVGPENALSLSGMLIVCGDSHTCTHGAVGALAYGLGTNELVHALATSCMIARKPKTMEVRIEGRCPEDVDSMDIILYILSQYGIDFAKGYAIEYTGNIVREMEVEERFTLCNLSIELGAETVIISPDKKTLQYLYGKTYAPKGAQWEMFQKYCHEIASDDTSEFNRTVIVDITNITRQVSWGINPSHTIGVDEVIPLQRKEMTPEEKKVYDQAYEYMGVLPGTGISGTKIEMVFIGSCANGSLSALCKAAETVKGKKVKCGVKAYAVPGSVKVKREAEQLGIDKILLDAGFYFSEPGCALCVGSNGEVVSPGERCVSTTNRNFIGRQGVGARTHLASVRTAALAAITGEIG